MSFPFSRGSSQSRDQTNISCISCIGRQIVYHWATWEACPWNFPGILENTGNILEWVVISYSRHLQLLGWFPVAPRKDLKKKKKCVELPFGSVVKNLPANAGDAVSIPGLGDPTCSRAAKPVRHNYWACAPEPESHNCWDHLPQLLKPVRPRAHARQQEKPLQWEARAWQLESSLYSLQLEKSPGSMKT